MSVWKKYRWWREPGFVPRHLTGVASSGTLAIGPLEQLVLLRRFLQGLWKSTDGDQTWQRTGLAIQPFDEARLLTQH